MWYKLHVLFAHLPSGYLLAFVNQKWFYAQKFSKEFRKRLVFLSTFGSVFPDIDIVPAKQIYHI